MKNVFIVDDALMIRERLRAMLGQMPDVQLVGEASSAPQAIEA